MGIRDLWHRERPTNWREDTVRQFRNVLTTRYEAAVAGLADADRDRKRDLLQRIDAAFRDWETLPEEGDESYSTWWRNAHAIEQLTCFIEQGPLLDADIEERLRAMTLERIPGTEDVRAAYAALKGKADADSTSAKQALLFNMVAERQNRSQRRAQIRHMRLEAVAVVSRVASVVLVLVAVPVLLYILDYLVGAPSFVNDFVDNFPNLGLFTAVSFGALGALFSRFLVLQDSKLDVHVDEAAAFYRTRYILLRVLVGTVGAIIVYYFLAAELISGDLVPDISALNFEPVVIEDGNPRTFLGTWSYSMVPSKDMALLVVWSFLAGFSERLVPNLLKKSEAQAQIRGAAPPPPANG